MLNAGYVRRCVALIRGDPASTERDVNHNNETPDSTRDINPSCLTLAHRLLHDDREAGMFRLGLSAVLADLLPTLTRADAVSIGRCKLQINPLVSVFGHPCLPGVRQGADRRRVDAEAPRRVWGFVLSRCF
ncbi:hypothetical protein WK66_06895 [Burkholderia ubonensis]|uniref:flagellar transcriptional regulator FlhD n=1 Tax=Burkholderia ubonensis TaxID=101571 RepID=UPI0007559AF4|nr:flagellar transcriptional regulator FlhD [Burkholderia ubonensis]KVU29916.1 hypothetical protein WK66_06895 [Burkholderia ubonensis]